MDAAENLQDYRTRIYKQYVDGREQPLAPPDLSGFKHRGASLRKLIRQHFPSDREASIIDLGCGHGALIYFARRSGYRNMFGVDCSPQQVAEAERLGVEGVRQGDVMETLRSLRNASQDAVVSFDVIEHFKKDELITLVDEVGRVLKTDGKWIIHTCNGEALFGVRSLYNDMTHEWAFTRTSITQLLLSSGFRRVECFEDVPVAHGVKSGIRWLLWKMFRSVARVWLIVETGERSDSFILSQNLLAVGQK